MESKNKRQIIKEMQDLSVDFNDKKTSVEILLNQGDEITDVINNEAQLNSILEQVSELFDEMDSIEKEYNKRYIFIKDKK